MCEHKNIKLYSRLFSAQTLYEPAEYEYKAVCSDCGEEIDYESIPEDANVIDSFNVIDPFNEYWD